MRFEALRSQHSQNSQHSRQETQTNKFCLWLGRGGCGGWLLKRRSQEAATTS